MLFRGRGGRATSAIGWKKGYGCEGIVGDERPWAR